MFLQVKQVSYLKDYQLRLEFNNGIVKDLDLHDELQCSVNLLPQGSVRASIPQHERLMAKYQRPFALRYRRASPARQIRRSNSLVERRTTK